jgi:hypothetical protein
MPLVFDKVQVTSGGFLIYCINCNWLVDMQKNVAAH